MTLCWASSDGNVPYQLVPTDYLWTTKCASSLGEMAWMPSCCAFYMWSNVECRASSMRLNIA